MCRPGPRLLVPVALLGLVWAVYGGAGRFPFVDFDDPAVVVDNPHVNTGLTAANARWALTGSAVGHWEPLTWLSLQADVSAWGVRAGPMHVENVLLHAAGSVVLLELLVSATGAVAPSAVVAALFAVHPMHVESVAWVTERRDVLSTPLLLAAVWAYVRHVRADAGRARWYAGFLVLYTLSLSAKATGVTLPVALLAVDAWPLRRPRLAVPDKVPVAVLAAATAVAAVAAQRAAGAASTLREISLPDRLANAVVTTVVYVVKLAVPTGLAAIYPHPGTRPPAAVAAAASLLALATGFAWRQRHRRPYLLAGWTWFLVTLLPTSGIVQSGTQAMADRYSYVPSIGLFAAAVWALADAPAVLTAFATVAIVAFAVLARRQVGFWSDTQTLFTHANTVTVGNSTADVALGNIALNRGQFDVAEGLFRRAVNEQPGDARAYVALGNYHLTRGDPATAADLFATAVRLRPTVADFRLRHARALAGLPGRRAAAVAELRAAVSLDPSNPAARAGLADLLARPPEAAP